MTTTTLFAAPVPPGGIQADYGLAGNFPWQTFLNYTLGFLIIALLFVLAGQAFKLKGAQADARPGEESAAKTKMAHTGIAIGVLALFQTIINVFFVALG